MRAELEREGLAKGGRPSPRDNRNYIPRGGARLCRASLRRRYRFAPRPRHLQSAEAHRPAGTILLPGLLLLLHSPFLFGYAKPVPVNFRALRNPRRDMVWVAAAGPGMNIVLAVVAALLFHLVGYLPDTAAQWVAENLKNALIINVFWRSSICCHCRRSTADESPWGCFPDVLAAPLARLEPYGMMILIGVLLILPMIGAQMGLDFSVVSHVVAAVTNEVIAVILRVTGHT